MIIPTRDFDQVDLLEQSSNTLCKVIDRFNDLCWRQFSDDDPMPDILKDQALIGKAAQIQGETNNKIIQKFPFQDWVGKVGTVAYRKWQAAMLNNVIFKSLAELIGICDKLEIEFNNWKNKSKPNSCKELARKLTQMAEESLDKLRETMKEFENEYPSPSEFSTWNSEAENQFVETYLAVVLLSLIMVAIIPAIPGVLTAVASSLAIARIAATTTTLVGIVHRIVQGGVDPTDTDALIEAIKNDPEFQAVTTDIANSVLADVKNSEFPVNCDELARVLEDQSEILQSSDFDLLPQRCSDGKMTLYVAEPDALDCELHFELNTLKNLLLDRCQFLNAIPENEFE